MAELNHGTVGLTIADHIQVPPEAGHLTPTDLARIEKARRGVGITAQLTAEAGRKHPHILPDDVTPDELEAQGKQADDIDLVISDVESLLTRLKQANVMIDGKANQLLRKVLAHVRSKEKFSAGITNDVPHLIAYFSNNRAAKAKDE